MLVLWSHLPGIRAETRQATNDIYTVQRTMHSYKAATLRSVLASVVHEGPPLRLPAVHEALTAPSPPQANAKQKKKATRQLRSAIDR